MMILMMLVLLLLHDAEIIVRVESNLNVQP